MPDDWLGENLKEGAVIAVYGFDEDSSKARKEMSCARLRLLSANAPTLGEGSVSRKSASLPLLILRLS